MTDRSVVIIGKKGEGMKTINMNEIALRTLPSEVCPSCGEKMKMITETYSCGEDEKEMLKYTEKWECKNHHKWIAIFELMKVVEL